MTRSFREKITGIGYYLKNALRYWRISFKLIFSYSKSEWSEITVDELLDRFNSNNPPLILDIRTVPEFNEAHIPNAKSIPITKIAKSKELQPFKEKEIVTCCPGGGLSLAAVDVLVKAGFKDVKSLREGMDLWVKKGYPTTKGDFIKSESVKDKAEMIEVIQSLDEEFRGEIHYTVDARNFSCPTPVLKSMKALKALKIGQVLEILATDPGSKADIPAWVRSTGNELLIFEERKSKDFRYLVKRII
jgi:rhodanese-related sulfurtransferase/TusA-related sulfurtransferase